MELVLLKMVPLLWSMLPLCTADNGTSAPENGASGCHKKLHSCCKLCLLLLTFIPSPFAAVNSTTIVVVDSSFSSCLWQLKMLLWWLSCFKCFMFFLMLLMGLPAAAAKSAFLAVKCSCRCFLFLLLIMELVCCKGCF
jgi:hypothetical protein